MFNYPLSFNKVFNAKYPIIAAAMNRVSDLKLALAIHRAGAVPSISLIHDDKLDINFLEKNLLDFYNQTGSTEIVLSIALEDSIRPEIIDTILKHNFKFIELFNRPQFDSSYLKFKENINLLKSVGIQPIIKTLKAIPHEDYDIVMLKGSEGAGRTRQDSGSLEKNFNILKTKKPNTKIIPSGGIYSKEQIEFYLSKGALAIGIGTLFALSEESCLSLETKKEMLLKTSKEIEFKGEHNHRGIVFSHIEKDDDNNTGALVKAIASPKEGMLFIGNAISHINSIKPVKDIILDLVGGNNDS